MNQEAFYILTKPDENTPEIYICFTKFIEYLQERTQNEVPLRAGFYRSVLQHFLSYPGINGAIAAGELHNYKGLLDILHACLFPRISNDENTMWALSAADADYVFYSTNAFFNLMSPFGASSMFAQASEEEKKAFYDSICEVRYALILDRLYDLQPYLKKDIIYVWTDKTSGLPTYFNIDVENSFVEVKAKDALPAIDKAAIGERIKNTGSLCELEDVMPLSAFSFEGFTVSTATDITARHSLHKMRSALIKHDPEHPGETYEKIIYLLKALCGNADIDFGLLPFLKLSGQLVLFYDNYSHSIIINIGREQELDKELLLTWLKEYSSNPRIIFHKIDEETEAKHKTAKRMFQKAGIREYALLPVYQKNEMIGLLEMSSKKNDVLNQTLLPRFEAAMPILAQLMYTNQAELAASVDKVVSANFTSIQPAVQWKFEEAAWHYLTACSHDETTPAIEPIRFEGVYPLYGAIDIRDSTVEKNSALYKDMQWYSSFLLQTLSSLPQKEEPVALEFIKEGEELHTQPEFVLVNNEGGIIDLMKKVSDFMAHLAEAHPEQKPMADAYFKEVDPASGAAFQHRRALESSMQTINTGLNKHLDETQAKYQNIYPVYFEKFRTDGVEYDMYAGQSIAPQRPYKDQYLHQLRFEQLRSMATIVRLVHSYEPCLSVPLQTTQLIYVNANSIDISFRLDEKRFDVEGAYNTRYHIVKKRIDKALVKDTHERLTQPCKIAIVYSQKEHAAEYKEHIAALQKEGLLQPGEEELELEELQGVTGLSALRVSVVF